MIRSLAVITVAMSASRVLAQPAAEAEVLFRKGKELVAQGKFAEACAAFDTSQKLDPALTTLIRQADCREKNGQLATAWGLFLEAKRQARTAVDTTTQQLLQLAVDRASKIEPRLSTLEVDIPTANQIVGLEISRDGIVIGPAAWNQKLPIDGGTYHITARAPGNSEWTTTIIVAAERDVQRVEVPKLAAAVAPTPEPVKEPAPPQPAPPTPSQPAPVAPEQPPAATTVARSRVPLVLGASAVALAGLAVAFDLWGDSTYDQAKTEPARTTQLDLWRSANAKRYTAEVMGVGALGCAAAAVWLYVRGRQANEPTRAVVVTPIGVAAWGRF
jgi:hypothetical protein